MKWLRRSPAPADPAAPAPAPGAAKAVPIAGWRVLLALALCAANALVSGLLLLQHHGSAGAASAVEQLCGPGEASGCAAVASSRWSRVAGVPLAAVGLVFYAAAALLLLLGLMAGPQARDAAAALALLGLVLAMVADVVLLGIQAVAIRAFCRLCLLTYVLNALALVVLLPARRDGAVVGEAVTRTEGRVALAAWVLCVLSLGGGVAIAEHALGRAPAASSVLGATPAGGGTELERYREEARAATEQARRLQEILDDPQRLERYFADKAAREFEQGPVHALELRNVPVKGPPEAPIKVVEYSDFLCPFCRNVAAAFNSYLPGSGGRVAVYYKHYPLDAECNPSLKSTIHPGACLLAAGGVCAQEQGRFWPYHDRVFAASPSHPQPADVVRLAAEAGLDTATFQTCLSSPAARERVRAEVAEGTRAGVNSTPTLFINGKRLPRVNDFAATVDKEAGRLGLPPLPRS